MNTKQEAVAGSGKAPSEKIRIIYVSNMYLTADADGKIVAERDNLEDAQRYLKTHVNVAIDPTPEIEREWLKPTKF